MKKTALIAFLFYLSMHAIAQHATPIDTAKQTQKQFPKGEDFKNANITYKTIMAANNTWCYDIYVENRLVIHQPSIPGLPGNEGFKSKEAAKKVAELVISKMKKGEMPPSITKEEMKKLKAI